MRTLLQYPGLDINAKGQPHLFEKLHWTALGICVSHNNHSRIAPLFDYAKRTHAAIDTSIPCDLSDVIMLSASECDQMTTKLLLDNHKQFPMEHLNLSFGCALAANRLDNARLFLDPENTGGVKVDINARDAGDAPLIRMTRIDQVEAVQFLLGQPNIHAAAPNNKGRSAVFYAARFNFDRILNLLLDHLRHQPKSKHEINIILLRQTLQKCITFGRINREAMQQISETIDELESER